MELKSIAFIPDGNRRYAKKSGIDLIRSYKVGTQKAWEVLGWLVKYPSIKAGTFYTLSLENLTRNKTELKVLFKIFERELDKITERTIFETEGIKLNFLGRREMFPKSTQAKMAKAEELTENYKARVINLALGYNGQAEIVDAAKKLAREYSSEGVDLNTINEATFKNYMYSDFIDPDLIVRTGGTQRLSGFLTYQSAYSELYFLDKYWPELTEPDLNAAIAEYQDRCRRFGK